MKTPTTRRRATVSRNFRHQIRPHLCLNIRSLIAQAMAISGPLDIGATLPRATTGC